MQGAWYWARNGEQHGPLDDAELAAKDPARACRAFRAFYSAFLRMPERDAVAALRAMFGRD